jgi:hypothetical protein
MHVRELLIPILRQVIARRASGGSVEWDGIFTGLEEAKAEAITRMPRDPGVAQSFVSAVNLMVDCICGRIDAAMIRDAVEHLDVADGWDSAFGIDLLRKGAAVSLPPGDSSPAGWTAVKWSDFLRYYAPQLGYLPDDAREAERLWSDLKANMVRLPLADLDLADPVGGSSTWVADDRQGGRLLITGDPQHDLYDALGLTWRPPHEKTRVVLISCQMSMRQIAARSLHCPTAVDGWGNLLFVPRQPQNRAWPDHGAATARPTSDDVSFPEAIHGPAKTNRLSVSLYAVDEIDVGDRVGVYGADVMERAMTRLRRAIAV